MWGYEWGFSGEGSLGRGWVEGEGLGVWGFLGRGNGSVWYSWVLLLISFVSALLIM